MNYGFGWSEEERKEIADSIAGGTHTAYGSGWGGIAITNDYDDDDDE